MERKLTLLARLVSVAASASLSLLICGSSLGVPGILNHQGRIAVSGVNLDGTGHFKFALVDGTGAVTYWSNDATSSAGSEPAASLAVPVVKGHYSVALGEPNPIPADVFAENEDVRLRVWFSQSGTGGTFEPLTPDRRIASTGYALSAGTASAVQPGAVDGLDSTDGSERGVAEVSPLTQLFTDNLAVTGVDIDLVGNVLYVVDDAGVTEGIEIYQIDTPSQVTQLGVANLPTLSIPTAIAIDGTTALIADKGTRKLHAFGIANPAVITTLGETPVIGALNDVDVMPGHAVLASSVGLRVYDVSDPNNLTLTDSIPGNVAAVTVAGTTAYGIDSSTDLLGVFDLTNPAALVARGSDGTGLSFPVDLAVAGNFVYVLDRNTGVRVFDVTDPDTPAPRGSHPLEIAQPEAIIVGGDLVHVAGFGGVEVFDVTDPDNLKTLGDAGDGLGQFHALATDGASLFAVGEELYGFAFETSVRINSDLDLGGALVDESGAAGTAGQILASTEDGVEWVDATLNSQTLVFTGASIALSNGGGSVSVSQIANALPANSVGAFEIAPNAVGMSEIAANAVGFSEIVANAVGSSEIATNAVGSVEIAASAVGTSEIADGSIRSSDIGSGAVGSSQILNGSVTGSDIAPGLVLANSSYPVFTAERTTSSVGSQRGTIQALHSTTADMGNGFGPTIEFSIEDTTSGAVGIGQVGAERAGGADNVGNLIFRTANGGAPATRMRLDQNGNLTTSGTVNGISDRDKKENFQPVDSAQVLEKIAALPIARWNYKHDTESTPHLGPVAQDFYRAFGLGMDDRHIATVDADGVALAAIQGLNAKLEAENVVLQSRTTKLEAENVELRSRLEKIEAALDRLAEKN